MLQRSISCPILHISFTMIPKKHISKKSVSFSHFITYFDENERVITMKPDCAMIPNVICDNTCKTYVYTNHSVAVKSTTCPLSSVNCSVSYPVTVKSTTCPLSSVNCSVSYPVTVKSTACPSSSVNRSVESTACPNVPITMISTIDNQDYRPISRHGSRSKDNLPNVSDTPCPHKYRLLLDRNIESFQCASCLLTGSFYGESFQHSKHIALLAPYQCEECLVYVHNECCPTEITSCGCILC